MQRFTCLIPKPPLSLNLILLLPFHFFLKNITVPRNCNVYNNRLPRLRFVWTSLMNFSICLDCKIPQRFYSLILCHISWDMLVPPFVTTTDSDIPIYHTPNCAIFLHVYILFRQAWNSYIHKICCTVSSWPPNVLHLGYTICFLDPGFYNVCP